MTRVLTPRALRVSSLLRGSLFRNALHLLSGTMISAAGGYLFWQVCTHLVPPEELGRATALVSTATFIANLGLLGMNNATIQYLASWPRRTTTINTGLTVVVAGSALGSLGLVATGKGLLGATGDLRTPGYGVLFVACTVGLAASLYTDNVFIALRVSHFVLRRNVLATTTRLVLPFALVGMLHGFGVFAAYALSTWVAFLFYLYVLRSSFDVRLGLHISTERLQAMWRYSGVNYLATTATLAPNLLMPVIVTESVGATEGAYFYIASLLAGLLLLVPQATSRSLFAEGAHDRGSLRSSLTRAAGLTALGNLPALALLLLTGREVLGLFGDPYRTAYPLLVVLGLTAALSSISFLGSTLLLIEDRLRLLCALSGAFCLVCLGGGLLTPRYGALAASFALLAGESMLALSYACLIWRATRRSGAADEDLASRPAASVRGDEGRPPR